jgi:hypothetical protein
VSFQNPDGEQYVCAFLCYIRLVVYKVGNDETMQINSNLLSKNEIKGEHNFIEDMHLMKYSIEQW